MKTLIAIKNICDYANFLQMKTWQHGKKNFQGKPRFRFSVCTKSIRSASQYPIYHFTNAPLRGKTCCPLANEAFPNHTMTAGRGGAGTTRHEIRGGKNWLAIFICAQLNKREAAALLCILSQGGREGGAGKVESMEPGWDGKRYYRAGGIYCLVQVQRGYGRG